MKRPGGTDEGRGSPAARNEAAEFGAPCGMLSQPHPERPASASTRPGRAAARRSRTKRARAAAITSTAMATPLEVEVIVHAPTVFHHCQHCEIVWHGTGFDRGVHEEQLRSALPEDLQREYAAVWQWVHRLLATHRDRVAVKVTDATSLRGVWKALRHGLHRYPAIIVDGREKLAGVDPASADALVARHLSAAPPGRESGLS